MLRAQFRDRSVVCCPSCRSDRFVIARRRPEPKGRVFNTCACRRCGTEFEYQEDRAGKPIRTSATV